MGSAEADVVSTYGELPGDGIEAHMDGVLKV